MPNRVAVAGKILRWGYFCISEVIGWAGLPGDLNRWGDAMPSILEILDMWLVRATLVISGIIVLAYPKWKPAVTGFVRRPIKVAPSGQPSHSQTDAEQPAEHDDGQPDKAQVTEWLAFVDEYQWGWIDTGELSVAGATLERNIKYESMWVEMRPFLAGDTVRLIEQTTTTGFSLEDPRTRIKHLKRLVRRDLGVLLRKIS